MVDLEPARRTRTATSCATWVRRHHEETDSAVAERLLADGDDEVDRFVKVMPLDYKRVLEAERQRSRRGEDALAAIMAAPMGA